jgi:Tfp pilus assembly protein PilF/SAM-dependent methyltransferase
VGPEQATNVTIGSPNIPQAMQSAMMCFQSGDLSGAEKICRAILLEDAGCAAANHVLGVVVHRQGRSVEGIDYLRKAIESDPRVADAHNNLGNILKDVGQLDEATASFRKAIDLQPENAMAHYNLGAAYRQGGESDLALESYRRALEIEPNNAAVHNNMGNVLRDLGRLEEAASSYDKAVALNPAIVEAHFNLAEARRRSGDHAAAMTAYVNALGVRVDHAPSMRGLGLLVAGATIEEVAGEAVPQARLIVMACLARDDVEHQDFYHAAVGLLTTPETEAAIDQLLTNAVASPNNLSMLEDERIVALLNDPLFQQVLSRTTVVDEKIEGFLTILRRLLLSSSAGGEGRGPDVVIFPEKFIYALASQCHTTEYICSMSDDEAAAVARLRSIIESRNRAGEDVDDNLIVVLACYEPLTNLDSSGGLKDAGSNQLLAHLVGIQVRQPQRVRAIAGGIESLSPVDDDVSRDVRRQYEEHPYPPWTVGYAGQSFPFVQCLAADIHPCNPPKDIAVENPEVLIAGCGTGQHAINSARRYNGARVLAIDLSRQSLAYGKHKAHELGVENIEFLQADILDLANLDRQFDVIESVGVLHHMKEPLEGLGILNGLLRPGGLLKLGLYSALARQDVAAVRRFVDQQNLGTGPADIRRCREAIFSLPAASPARFVTHPIDFYSMSAARDFLFHVQEHVFTLPEIGAALIEQNLEFLGFVIDVATMKSFSTLHGGDESFLSLDNWNEFEKAHPHTFRAMYQFWTRKSA